MEHNRFLMDFMKMRKNLNAAPTIVPPTAPTATATSTKTALVPTGVKTEKPVMEDDITYRKIIEDKPPKSEVLQYFRNRIEELKAEKDI